MSRQQPAAPAAPTSHALLVPCGLVVQLLQLVLLLLRLLQVRVRLLASRAALGLPRHGLLQAAGSHGGRWWATRGRPCTGCRGYGALTGGCMHGGLCNCLAGPEGAACVPLYWRYSGTAAWRGRAHAPRTFTHLAAQAAKATDLSHGAGVRQGVDVLLRQADPVARAVDAGLPSLGPLVQHGQVVGGPQHARVLRAQGQQCGAAWRVAHGPCSPALRSYPPAREPANSTGRAPRHARTGADGWLGARCVMRRAGGCDPGQRGARERASDHVRWHVCTPAARCAPACWAARACVNAHMRR